MKIAIPRFEDPDTFADNVAFTLRAMGHEVFTRGARPVSAITARLPRRWDRLRTLIVPRARTSYERWVLRLAKKIELDLVLALTQALSEETLVELKRLGVKACVAWWGDTPQNMERMGLLTEEWNQIFLKDPDAVEKFRSVGLQAELLHEAMNPAWHRPETSQTNGNVVIAGSLYGYRQFMVRKLVRCGVGVNVYGPPPPRWAIPEARASHRGRYIVRTEKSRIFGAGLACLNGSPPTEGNSLNCRAFEIAGAGGLQFFDYRPIIEQCFEPGREILVFRSFQELMELIHRAAQEPREMRLIREAGARRAAAEHTYEERLRRILRSVA